MSENKFNINKQMQYNSTTIHAEPHCAAVSEFDINEQMQYNSATIRDELHSAASIPKKFSSGNDINSGEVPEELQGLMEIEEMLIAQVFLVISVYKLYSEQYGYCRNIINFLQDVYEFTTHLS
ncbi:hypothetical protein C2G38_2221715 [Gigaspora rosea]|uniref:DUF6570 domain-containing protein n=1 Tax=Gigaspora rosea TaxID=44941 RepID=A0A397U6I0_9GLOM|nr:hypothetical protein C2G38_2221715 [Gigaspora rosea]